MNFPDIASPLALVCLLAAATLCRAAATPTVDGPTRSPDGILTYTLTSEYLAGPNAVEVLLPDKMEDGKRYAALYVLPVNPGTKGRWGSGIAEAKRTNVHNLYGLVCVAPAFDSWPWFADHPTDPKVRQESHLLKAVLPLVEERHPVIKEPRGRLLVGFSKSGWGAFSLLLRHPDIFGRAAAWDAPLMQPSPTKYEMPAVFATQENFDAYRIDRLLEKQAATLKAETLKGGPPRLVLMGYGNFRTDTQIAHEKMAALGIPHVYENETKRPHDWHSGWFAEAVKHLVSLENPSPRPPP
jgi:hypothetical protein